MRDARAQFIRRESFPSPEPRSKKPENYVVDWNVSSDRRRDINYYYELLV